MTHRVEEVLNQVEQGVDTVVDGLALGDLVFILVIGNPATGEYAWSSNVKPEDATNLMQDIVEDDQARPVKARSTN